MHRLRRILDFILVVLLFVSLAIMFLANDDPFVREKFCRFICFRSLHATALNKILYDIAAASLVSLIFYYLVVRVPDFLKRSRIKKVFTAQYKSFRSDCIAIFLSLADGSYDSQFPEKLLQQAEFRNYFTRERWDAVANKIEGINLGELINRMEIFRDDILFVLNNTDIGDDEAFEFFQRLSAIIYSTKNVNPDYDGIKVLCRFLWEVFSGWSFVEGYSRSDIIEDMIKAI